jgi:uncharacterized protein (TIGR02217 family)
MTAIPEFPTTVAYGSTFGPEFKTRIFEADSGFEQRNAVWSNGRLMCNVGTGIQKEEHLDALLAFFRVVRGRAGTFRFKDWSDYTLSNAVIGTGDDLTTAFQAIQTYVVGASTVTRNITRLVETPKTPGAVNEIMVNNVVVNNYTIDYDTGIITFNAAPATGEKIKIIYMEFDVPCRFDTDKIELNLSAYKAGNWSGIPIKEVRE